MDEKLSSGEDSLKGNNILKGKIRPSEFLRQRRPERYSDSIIKDVPELTRNQLEYHLDTLTSRSQEKEFEHFARKLAEKLLCPNLIPQTGPTGGGDSKVDSETYPVADSIANTWYQGDASASERWGFAFSAKKAWAPKVKDDIKKISETKRGYSLIYFISNQFISDKKRAEREDALTNEFNIPVRIIDRSWIVDKVFNNDCIGIVEQTLSIENLQFTPNKIIGPNDLERGAALAELESDIADVDRYTGVKYQQAEDILKAAILASELEKPRMEVDGRFKAASRVAETVGDNRQLLRIYYKWAWVSCFVYDDVVELNDLYEIVEQIGLASSYADDVESVQNLFNVLISVTKSKALSEENAKIISRGDALQSHLEKLSIEDSSPNNALHAKGMLCLHNLAMKHFDESLPYLVDQIFLELKEVLSESTYLGVFPFEAFKQVILELGSIYTENQAYDELYDTLLQIIEKRSSEGAVGTVMIDRAIQKSSSGKNIEAIAILGQAQEKLVKEEYKEDLVKSLVVLGGSYNAIGLNWAARMNYLAAISISISEFNKSGFMHYFAYVAIKQLVFIELRIGRIPHVLFAISLSNFIRLNARVKESEFTDFLQHVDAILSMLILRLDLGQLEKVKALTSTLDNLNLICTEGSLLFSLGHLKKLKEDVWFDENEEDSKIEDFYQLICAQPANDDLPTKPELGEMDEITLSSKVLGANFQFTIDNYPIAILLAESLAGALESFFATSLNRRIVPHKQEVLIRVSLVENVNEKFGISVKSIDGEMLVQFDEKLTLSTKDQILSYRDKILEFIVLILSEVMFVVDAEQYIEKMAAEERIFSRSLLFSDILTLSQNVFGGLAWSNITSWPRTEDPVHPVVRTHQWKPKQFGTDKNDSKKFEFGEGEPPEEILNRQTQKHSEQKVLSILNMQLWDKARWGGVFFQLSPKHEMPPCLGFLFNDADAARSIFEEWRKRFGPRDDNDEILIVVVTGIDKKNPTYYRVFVTSNIRNYQAEVGEKLLIIASRHNEMTPNTTKNLDNFLESYGLFGCYYLLPAVITKGNLQPEVLPDSYIMKKNLQVRQAWTIGANDDAFMVLHPDDDPIIPAGEKNPPVLKALAKLKNMQSR